MTNVKYVVFPRRAWDWSSFPLDPKDEVKDAVVIRLQDVFAESALWTYANEIRAALEILALMEVPSDHPKIVRLHEIADYFQAMSMAAGRAAKKVPD